MQYLIDHEIEIAVQHIATIARLEFNSLERGMVPDPLCETATVTFLKMAERTYAVTAGHAIEAFEEIAKNNGHHYQGYMCLQDPGVAILGPFLVPPANYPHPVPDIAICPIDEGLPSHIGKTPFEVLAAGDAKWPVEFGLAFGFPTAEKYDLESFPKGTKMALPCVRAVAEGLNSTGASDQVQFHSNLPKAPSVKSLSGMSGGPVFWSNGAEHGLVGFVKEALDVTPKEGEETFYTEPKVNFICQRADYSILKNWFKFVDDNWQNERSRIGNSLR